MKMKWRMGFFLLLVLCASVQSYALQTDSDRAINQQIIAKAEAGDASSQCALAEIYGSGKFGVIQDYTEAIKWFRKSAEQGHAEAEDGLGVLYRDGLGVATNSVEAAKWFRKSAEQGFVEAQDNLGHCYAFGEGVSKDEAEAVKWYLKAAEQGDAMAQTHLGTCYGLGNGVSKDNNESIKWYRKAAEQGFPPSQVILGVIYASGTGLPKDYVEAYKWLNLASAQSFGGAEQYLSNLEKRMTPDQIAEAQRRSSAFVPRKEKPHSNFNKSTSLLNPSFTGTGFFITDDGYLISNAHVVEGASQIRLVTSMGFIDAKVVKVDLANDLALLKAEGKFSSLPIAASRGVKLGNTVATVGFPNIGLQGFAPKLAKGEIASLSGASDDARYFQISVPVQPGNSGGALVDERGNVVGIVSAKLNASAALAASGSLPENVNYAVKSSFLLSFLESVPAVSAKLKSPNTVDEKFSDVVKSAQDAAVLVLVY
jgi:S1-C subfamily serine protease/ribosomal protein L7/L12